MIDLAILGLLKDEPLHGYELRKRLTAMGAGGAFSYGSLYPALRRLERDSFILKTRPAGTLRGKKVYALTAAGTARFFDLLADDSPADRDRTFAVKLAFFRHVAAEARLEALEDRRAEVAERLHEARKALRAAQRNQTIDRYTLALLHRAVQREEVDLHWIDGLLTAELATEPSTGAALRREPA